MDRSAFERLYREHFDFVWAAVRRLGVSAAVVDDAVQDVFVTAFRKLDEIDADMSPRGWLYGVARRVAFRYRRTQGRTLRRRARLRVAAVDHEDEPHVRHDAARQLERFLHDLDRQQRETFVMSELLGMSGPEIAAQHSVPLNTVYSRLRLARRRLTETAMSTERAQAWVAHSHRADAATAADRRRVWSAIVPLLKPTAGLGGLGATAVTGWVVLGAIIGGGVLGLSRLAGPHAPAPTRRPPTVQVSPAAIDHASARPSAPIVRAPTAHVAAVDAPTPRPPAREPVRARARPKSEPTAAAPEPTDGSDALRAELALIDRARGALGRGDAREALARLDEHGRVFERGQLADVRDATRVKALCALGRTDQARAEHERLLVRHPQSNVVQSDRERCW